MPPYSCRQKRWAVILAGGEGTRLRPLTRLVTGDDTPKQFCNLLAGKTLLTHTRERIARDISPDRTLFVLLREQERYYRRQLTDVQTDRMVVQPSNRGTLPAILCSLMRVMNLDPEAVVAFFPSDHHYANEENFMTGIDLAFQSAEADHDALVLLGAPATHPETDYGWIEAEATVSSSSRNGLLRVKQFWEKPPLEVAEDLLERGCVWNTFVMVGHARAFLNVIHSCSPELCQSFAFAHSKSGPDLEKRLNALYDVLHVADISSQVLAASPGQLGVLCLGDVGWSDLGNPRRLIEVLSRNGEKNDWLPFWQQEAMRADSSREGAPTAQLAKAAAIGY